MNISKVEWHRKISLPVSIIIFFAIGAALGAIIRKGGLGMPIVISVVFFVIYYIISTSGEKMALYAANNINSAVNNFADRNYAKVRGVVMNRRNVEREEEKVRSFAESNQLEIVADIPRSDDIIRWEDQGKTVIEGDINCEASQRFTALAKLLLSEDNGA